MQLQTLNCVDGFVRRELVAIQISHVLAQCTALGALLCQIAQAAPITLVCHRAVCTIFARDFPAPPIAKSRYVNL